MTDEPNCMLSSSFRLDATLTLALPLSICGLTNVATGVGGIATTGETLESL